MTVSMLMGLSVSNSSVLGPIAWSSIGQLLLAFKNYFLHPSMRGNDRSVFLD